MLLAGIIYGSSLSLGIQDLKLAEPIIANLEILEQHGDTERLKYIRANCMELKNAAENLLSQTDTANERRPDDILPIDFSNDQFDDLLELEGSNSYASLTQFGHMNSLGTTPISSGPLTSI